MHVLVPLGGSECSRRALRHAVDVVTACNGNLDVVHFTDIRTEATDDVIEAAEEILTTARVEGEVEVITDIRLSEPRSPTHFGKPVLQLVDDCEYDHMVMGHLWDRRHGGTYSREYGEDCERTGGLRHCHPLIAGYDAPV